VRRAWRSVGGALVALLLALAVWLLLAWAFGVLP
jgi:hypothetical protein